MPNRSSQRYPAASATLIRYGTSIFLLAGGLLTITWLWCSWCSFPSNPWNDIRIAPAVALHKGISIYSSSGTGPVSTWIYGPLPLWILWPAGLASTALGALQVAGAIHILVTIVSFCLTCLFWPSSNKAKSTDQFWQRRLWAALVCILLVRNKSSGYQIFSADASGIALGLLSLLSLAHRRNWLAAVFAVCAAACKQTFVGLAVAELIWVYLALSPGAAYKQLGRHVIAALAISSIAVATFGLGPLWHTMIQIPGAFPWAEPSARTYEHLPYLCLFVGLPIVVAMMLRKHLLDRNSPFLLPYLAFFCTLPLAVGGFLKIGGNVNSLYSFWLSLPPCLAVLSTGKASDLIGRYGRLIVAAVPLLVASFWLQISHLPVVPNAQAYREAAYLAGKLHERIWFPLHPLVTLYSDGRFYHDLDGLNERALAGYPLSKDHFQAHIPRLRQASATLLPVGWGMWGEAYGRLPDLTPAFTFGSWRIDGSLK